MGLLTFFSFLGKLGPEFFIPNVLGCDDLFVWVLLLLMGFLLVTFVSFHRDIL